MQVRIKMVKTLSSLHNQPMVISNLRLPFEIVKLSRMVDVLAVFLDISLMGKEGARELL